MKTTSDYQWKYRRSAKGKAARKKADKKFRSSEYGKQYTKKYSAEYRAKSKYGLTYSQYESIIANASECDVCGILFMNGLKSGCALSKVLDHCHKTGAFRGVLCGPCNRAIGLFKDDPDLCIKAARYLKSFQL